MGEGENSPISPPLDPRLWACDWLDLKMLESIVSVLPSNWFSLCGYQVPITICIHLLSIAKQPDTLNKSYFTSKNNIFPLNDSVQINFGTARSGDFYKLLVQFQDKTHTHDQTGPKRCNENVV